MDIEHVRSRFIKHFDGTTGFIYASPGRINLIGEHTDYNGGFVFPGAVDKGMIAEIKPNGTDKVRAYSIDLKDYVEFGLNEEDAPRASWARYIFGVCREMIKRGVDVKGFNTAFSGDVPLGAGMSSSAALESTYAFALNELFGENKIDKFELAKVGQATEHNYCGVNCGIMDQFASVFGKAGSLIRLDCRSLEYQYFPFHPEGYRLVLMDSVVKHELASSAYNKRRQSCEAAVAAIQKKHPHVEFLRDCTMEMLEEAKADISDEDYMRAEYVIEEIQRVLDVCDALEKDDYETVGQKMYETHHGMSKLYEVSCEELDFLNDCAKEYGVTGSGKPGKMITLKSYPGEIAKIDGSDLYIKGWGNALVQVNNIDYMQFENLHICHAHDSENNTDPEGIYITGTSGNITFRGCKVYDIKNDCPLVDAKGDWRSAHAILVLGTDDNTPIRNLLIEKCEIFEIHSGTSEAFTLAGNVVDFTIQDNEVHDVENIGIIIAGGDNLNPKGDISVNYARNGVVRRNKVYRCTHEKSQDYWSQSVSNGGAIGIYLCGNGNTIVEQNEVFECDRGIGLCSESYKLQTKDCIVRDNFVYNNFRTGIYMGAYLGFDGLSTKNCYVVNNTLFNNNLKGGQLDGTNNYLKVNDRDNSSEGEIRLSELCEENVIANNIIYAVSDRDIFIRKYTTSGKNNYIGGNIYFSPTKKNHKWIWDGKEYTDFSAWQAVSGDKTSVFDVDPLLKSTRLQQPDLHLKSSSPAIGTGLIFQGYVRGMFDVDGDKRCDNHRINIGADQ